jgi:hypothetical protein
MGSLLLVESFDLRLSNQYILVRVILSCEIKRKQRNAFKMGLRITPALGVHLRYEKKLFQDFGTHHSFHLQDELEVEES